jgi:hypothetical protein
MADRCDYFFRMRVREDELDLGFELLEQADHNFVTDIGVFGIIDGMIPSEHFPVPDISLDLTAPGRCYDQLGQRIFFGTGQNVDLSVDLNAVSTAVQTPGNEKWISLFVKFERLLSDPRTDGNSQQVYFRRDESFTFVVRQGAEAPVGAALRPPLQADEVLVCDVLRTFGQTQILNAGIHQDRRQKFVFAEADKISVFTGGFNTLSPTDNEVQATLQEIDDELTDHFNATARRHAAGDVDFTPYAYLASTRVQDAIQELVIDLAATTIVPGASRIGAGEVSGTPNALPIGAVDAQLAYLLAFINNHQNAPSGAHAGSAIANTPAGGISAVTVQTAINELDTEKSNVGHGHAATEVSYAGSGAFADGTPIGAQPAEGAIDAIVSLLADQAGAGADGAGRIGAEAQSSGAASVSRGNISSQILKLLQLIDGKGGTGVANTWSQTQTLGGEPGVEYPVTSDMRLLLYVPSSLAPVRIYADSSNLWITLNAEWAGTQWQASYTSTYRAALRIYRHAFYFYHQGTDPDTWTDWQYGLALDLSLTTKEFVDAGTSGLRQRSFTGQEGYCNGSSPAGGSWDYPLRFAAAPSTVTFTQTSKSPASWSVEPTLWSHDVTGGTWYGYPGAAGSYYYSGKVAAY